MKRYIITVNAGKRIGGQPNTGVGTVLEFADGFADAFVAMGWLLDADAEAAAKAAAEAEAAEKAAAEADEAAARAAEEARIAEQQRLADEASAAEAGDAAKDPENQAQEGASGISEGEGTPAPKRQRAARKTGE